MESYIDAFGTTVCRVEIESDQATGLGNQKHLPMSLYEYFREEARNDLTR